MKVYEMQLSNGYKNKAETLWIATDRKIIVPTERTVAGIQKKTGNRRKN